MEKMIRYFLDNLVGATLGGATLGEIANSSLKFKEATSSLISLSVLGNAAKGTKDIFKFK